jgi:anti-anti-sigma regulatory factor
MTFSIIALKSGVTRIGIEGQIDALTICRLRSELSSVVRTRPVEVEMELSRLRSIDSGCARMLLSFLTDLSRQGCRLRVKGLHNQPLKSFKSALIDAIASSEMVN